MGKTFVITRGGTGLGRAIARTLAGQGHTGVLLGRRLDKVEAVAAEIGNGSFALACDVADPDSVDVAFAEIAKRHQTIDGLINNAAVFRPFLVKDATNQQIDTIIDTNMKGAVHCARAAVPLLRKDGIIINIGSETVASRVAMFSIYQASKGGLERFTRALQQELDPEGIRVTLVRACKMFDEDYTWDVDTETMQKFFEENAKRGINQRKQPIASFASAGAQIGWLVNLPPDVQVTEMLLEARFA
ncbi:MAG: SDR family oxidoreductase [Novosphingobium sp.]|nr:SDR family oxidoreductase [Novosphingobium sp.]